MGLMTGSGCLSRFMGPVFVSYVYTILGTVWTFGITTAIMATSMVWLMFFQRRLVIPENKAGEAAKEPEEGTGASGAPADPGGQDKDKEIPAAQLEAVCLQDIKSEKG